MKEKYRIFPFHTLVIEIRGGTTDTVDAASNIVLTPENPPEDLNFEENDNEKEIWAASDGAGFLILAM